ncbi:MAG TPA: right-handed parallel beta-helix repeat-containing protein [Vicinamibacterales bacterium]|nr:right-handed parallel beta-helix repeat-containing protein [Vicinamibacterales bacterium]
MHVLRAGILVAIAAAAAALSSDPDRSLAAAPGAAAAEPWTAPAGIPTPEFGIAETAPRPPSPWSQGVAGFYYVDASRREATDDNNPFGTPAHPRQSIPLSLPPGAVVELHGSYDRAHSSPNGLHAHGTAAQPVFIRGASATARPLVRGPWELTATYTILENLDFGPLDANRTGELAVVAPGDHVAVRASDVHGNANGGGLGAVSWSPTAFLDHVVFAGNTIHDNGNVRADFDQDVHGIAVSANVSRLWVVDNELYRNSGDGIQINGGRDGQASTHHIYVARNIAHDNKQTGFWTKQATDVIFAENLCFGHRPGNSSYGQCMGLQYAPERVWFVSNHIHDCDFGIALSSDSDMGTGRSVFVVGNVIHRIHHSGEYNPGTGWSNAAIMMAGETVHVVMNNTISDVDAGINSPIGGTNVVVNNIIANVTEPDGNTVFVERGSPGPETIVRDNVFGVGARVRLGDRVFGSLELRMAPNRILGRTGEASLFVDPRGEDFRLASPAGDPQRAPADVAKVAAAYRALYGVDLPIDVHTPGAFDALSLRPTRAPGAHPATR